MYGTNTGVFINSKPGDFYYNHLMEPKEDDYVCSEDEIDLFD